MSVHVFDEMIGATIARIDGRASDDTMTFAAADGREFRFYHNQGCCETVEIEDIVGDITDLVGAPLVEAEEVSNDDAPECGWESYTWTFYRFATAKGAVTVRWLGHSNGYYSEHVDFEVVTPSGTREH